MKPQIENLGKVSVTVEKQYWTKDNQYPRLTIVEDITTIASYISRKDVPSGININDREYWIPLGRVSDYLEVFVEEEKTTLLYLEASVRNALKNNQEFHDGALNEVQSKVNYLDEIITNAVNTINSTNTTIDNNEIDRVSAENKRLTAENERVTKENERIAAEALRQNAEINRETAEQERQHKYTNEYDVYENNRRNAETLRNAAESARQEQEAYRIANENNRQNAENIRQSSENVRNSSETNRQQGEQARVTAENARIIAETNRQLQEGNYSDKPNANGSRWARFNQAEAERSNTAQQEESNRNAKFNSAETTRQNTFTTNEGKSTDAANSNGSRWARFNKTINDANTKINNKITEIQNKANQDLGDLTEFAERIDEIKDALETTPKIDGSYESMSVGVAHTLINDTTENIASVYTHRYDDYIYRDFTATTRTDTGTGTIYSIDPCSGFYNQLIKTDYEYDSNGVHVKSENNIISINGTTDNTGEVLIYPYDKHLLNFIGDSVSLTIYYIEGENKSFNIRYDFNTNSWVNVQQYGTKIIQDKCYSYRLSISSYYNNLTISMKFKANTAINCKFILLLTNLDLLFTYIDTPIDKLYYSFGNIVKNISYNPGTLITCKNFIIKGTTNNLMDGINVVTGSMVDNYPDYTTGSYKIPDRLIPVKPNTRYKYSALYGEGVSNRFYAYNKNKEYLPNGLSKNTDTRIIQTKENCYYMCGTLNCSSNTHINKIYEDNIILKDSNTYKSINIDFTKINITYSNCDITPELGLIGTGISTTSSGYKPVIEFKNGKTYFTVYNYLTQINSTPELINTDIGIILKYQHRYIPSYSQSRIYIIANNEIKRLYCTNYATNSFDIMSEDKLTKLSNSKILSHTKINEYMNIYYLIELDNIDDINNFINNSTIYLRLTINSYAPQIEIENFNNEFTTIRDGGLYMTPNIKTAMGVIPLGAQSTIKSLPKNYLTTTSLDSLLSALNTATGKTIDATYNETTQSYDFTVK